ncbi:hypothetical protein E3N88_09347 [Mikania micrantha]|uniref:Uncharacterized protein n=1 Tax=Mikania micrantha TaxID=192012 RepID=A0A5N6PKR6_9ASTR|nr:hypothetical protein E3N88_09347 [Mikania micrantha]
MHGSPSSSGSSPCATVRRFAEVDNHTGSAPRKVRGFGSSGVRPSPKVRPPMRQPIGRFGWGTSTSSNITNLFIIIIPNQVLGHSHDAASCRSAVLLRRGLQDLRLDTEFARFHPQMREILRLEVGNLSENGGDGFERILEEER